MKSSSSKLWEFFKIDLKSSENFEDPRPEMYQGLDPEALYTDLDDLRRIQAHPLVKGKWVDLGCGVGHSALLYGQSYPERQAVGIDFSLARIHEGERARIAHRLHNVELLHGDLLTDALPTGDTYFLYFPTGIVLDRILSELFQKSETFKLVVIESHGDLMERIKLELWLTELAEVPLEVPRHYPFAKIFESRPRARDVSFRHKLLLVQEGETQWMAESFGLTWQKGNQFLLQTPPRSIEWSQVREILSWQGVHDSLHLILKLRPLGELTISTTDGEAVAWVRKILVAPTFSLELSNSQLVEWSQIKTIKLGTTLCYDSHSSSSFSPPAQP